MWKVFGNVQSIFFALRNVATWAMKISLPITQFPEHLPMFRFHRKCFEENRKYSLRIWMVRLKHDLSVYKHNNFLIHLRDLHQIRRDKRYTRVPPRWFGGSARSLFLLLSGVLQKYHPELSIDFRGRGNVINHVTKNSACDSVL